MPIPSCTNLAAHSDFELTRDRRDQDGRDVGEESQDYEGEGA
ncbi:hypothetical protein M3C33_009770 [Micrococcus luteus]|nr:hypothetical protein [Micrococcus luteus]MCV7523396.1 hypothetical protein [Micrococcus luteus]MCV7643192.1 hypothetical protein [Micrococcus luteus]MCV7670324.1 hypothetical protein [Micrococcus luteus]MCV7676846.1 hypothetical protein [Micrococcus luteus]